jgi:hypothetical protein
MTAFEAAPKGIPEVFGTFALVGTPPHLAPEVQVGR